ncbi:hypothetical protein BH11PSE3_BH11PSE3_43600 [soil metagenome]
MKKMLNLPILCFMLAATLVATQPALALETLPGEPPIDDRGEPVAERGVRSDELFAAGRVVAVDSMAARIVLEYRPVPHLFLEGGTRAFTVDKAVSLKALTPGDKVRFDVERNGSSYTITRLQNSN